ncbi:MAG: DUF4859 domain-containing protein [Bacteroidaceae bacterium]|nr:DUF4859 domain-containing protein [Bacteroidaceae bacterium]
MKKFFLSALLLLCSLTDMAQKTVYIPNEWRTTRTDTLLYAESDPDGRYTWSKTRSKETDNVIVFWDKYYGDKAPNELAKSNALYVDIDDLLQKAEAFYDLECRELGFVNPETSNLAKYKVMILMNHTTDWVCYGGGYDYQVSALWLSPSTCHPVGHSVAHEVGHSFHYMCYSEDSNHGAKSNVQTGFHGAVGNGSVTWEQTAQWQANQSYPELMFDQSINVFRNSHNLAFTHEWHRYQSYWFFYYLCQMTGKRTAVADVWNYSTTTVLDFNQALMKQQGWSVADLYRHYYDYAARCATWDFDVSAPYRTPYIGDFHYAAALTDDGCYQVAFESAPQSTGFNVIPLQVPSAGTQVEATFVSLRPSNTTALAPGDPARYLDGNTQWAESKRSTYYTTGTASYKGFRLGYVALMQDGTRRYFQQDSIYCKSTKADTALVTMTLPEGVARLWMIVSPAPSKYYQHLWDEKYNVNDDAWPYTVAFRGTDIDESHATVYAAPTLDGREISDVYFTYDVYLPVRSNYDAVPVTVSGMAAQLLGTALQMPTSDIASKMTTYAAAGPKADKVMFYPIKPSEFTIVKRGSTANGYGHWFNAAGNATDYGSGFLFSEFNATSLTFNIGQYPGKVKAGQTYNIGQALVYNDGTQTATAYFRFRVHITDGQAGAELAEKTNVIADIPTAAPAGSHATYDLSGRRVQRSTAGLYIIDGKKVVVRH